MTPANDGRRTSARKQNNMSTVNGNARNVVMAVVMNAIVKMSGIKEAQVSVGTRCLAAAGQ